MGLNRPFAAGHSRDTKPPCWRAKSHWDMTNKMAYKIFKWYFPLFVGLFHCDFALQHGGFVPREWLAARDLLD